MQQEKQDQKAEGSEAWQAKPKPELNTREKAKELGQLAELPGQILCRPCTVCHATTLTIKGAGQLLPHLYAFCVMGIQRNWRALFIRPEEAVPGPP